MLISIDDISFDYGSKETLRDITFRIEKGKIVGILGQNGCGKTTLLKCIDRMLKPKAGCIMLEDIDANVLDDESKCESGCVDVKELSNKELARSIAVVSQSAMVSFPFTAYEAVKMGRYACKKRSKEEDMRCIINSLEHAGALEFADRNVNELSGGELRRVMIARALAQEPSALLLDEPTLHLDINHQFDLMNLIRKLKDEDMNIVMVTHDLMFAARFCDEVILMEKGRIVDAGPTVDVLTKENIRRIFDIDAIVEYDERVGGNNVVMIGR